jgi:glycosyltransferase involved in cell wall biosynthesis
MKQFNNLRVALVHDYIKEYGGAERVLEELHKLFPDAPIYTSVYLPNYLGPHRKRFESMKIKTSFLQYFPFKSKLISPFRLLAPFAFKNLNLSKYDVIIVSQTGAFFPNLVSKGKAKLICYTHTPPRYLYGYMSARDWKNNKFKLVIGSVMNHFLRIVDYNASKNVDLFIANSEEVARRIKKFYRRDSIIVYPPVEISSAVRQANSDKRSYFLAGGRLARAKGTDIIIDAFLKNKHSLRSSTSSAGLKKPLKIFGKGFAGFEEELLAKTKNRAQNIEFVGEVTDEEKLELMANAKAFIFSSFDEDFGITPVEAMSMGTPVIAYRSGGVKETVIEGKTGVFYEPNTPEALSDAVGKFERTKFDSEACRKQAEKFSSKNFDKKILRYITLKEVGVENH